MRDDRNRGVRLLRRLQLVLVVLLVVWFFSPPHVRSEVPLWLPFVLVLALEAQFVISSWRSSAPLVRPGDPTPGLADRERYGDGGLAEWAVVESDTGRVWVDISEPTEEEDEEEAVAAEPSRPRSLARALVEAAVALAAVTVLVLLLDRGNWNDLGPGARRAAESEFSVQASRVAGKPVRIECDTSGRHVGAVQHADGVATVGGRLAYITPELCYALQRLTAKGEVQSFSQTARAIAVLAHEAWHLRGVADEGRTECFALQSGVQVGQRLGLDEETARRMMRSQLVANQLHRLDTAEYVVPPACVNRGALDLNPGVDLFP
jgi:hypothetical protein